MLKNGLHHASVKVVPIASPTPKYWQSYSNEQCQLLQLLPFQPLRQREYHDQRETPPPKMIRVMHGSRDSKGEKPRSQGAVAETWAAKAQDAGTRRSSPPHDTPVNPALAQLEITSTELRDILDRRYKRVLTKFNDVKIRLDELEKAEQSLDNVEAYLDGLEQEKERFASGIQRNMETPREMRSPRLSDSRKAEFDLKYHEINGRLLAVETTKDLYRGTWFRLKNEWSLRQKQSKDGNIQKVPATSSLVVNGIVKEPWIGSPAAFKVKAKLDNSRTQIDIFRGRWLQIKNDLGLDHDDDNKQSNRSAVRSIINTDLSAQSGTGSETSSEDLAKLISVQAKYDFNYPTGPDLKLEAINVEQQTNTPSLSYGLDRVLFNQGVVLMKDDRSGVYNFDQSLEKLIPVDEFDFELLRNFTKPSEDGRLADIAKEASKKYLGSTSSMTGVLSQFHFLLSAFRQVNPARLSNTFPNPPLNFTKITHAPTSIFLRWNDGKYAIDADKEWDSPNILSLMGQYMERLLTVDKDTFERHRIGSSDPLSKEEASAEESFNYTSAGDFLIRSQLDASDPRLPGSGVFDLKTRAVLPIRMSTQDFVWAMDYELTSPHGEFHSYEREYWDMARSTLLKYSLQVRLGRMDGIFIAFHNIARIFGFQYMSLADMDEVLHGQTDRSLGDQELCHSLRILNGLLDEATAKYPKQSIRFTFETRPSKRMPFMSIYAEPMSEEEIEKIQTKQNEAIESFKNLVLDRDAATKNGHLPVEKRMEMFRNRVGEAFWPFPKSATAEDDKASPEATESGGLPDVSGQVPERPNHQLEDADATLPWTADKALSDSAAAEVVDSQDSTQDLEESQEAVTEAEVSDSQASLQDLEQLEDAASTQSPSADIAKAPSVEPGGSESDSKKPLLAWLIRIQNTVNGKVEFRPTKIRHKSGHQWQVGLNIGRMVDTKNSWRRYRGTQMRRERLLKMAEGLDEASELVASKPSYFMNMLRRVTEESRLWRLEYEEKRKE